jgi:hypothetical protein
MHVATFGKYAILMARDVDVSTVTGGSYSSTSPPVAGVASDHGDGGHLAWLAAAWQNQLIRAHLAVPYGTIVKGHTRQRARPKFGLKD